MAFHMDQFGTPKFRRLGSNVLVLNVDATLRLESQERIWRLHALTRAWDGVLESVPGMNNLTLLFDERCADATELEARLNDAWTVSLSGTARTGTLHVIDVTYGGDAGPDLESIAVATNMSEHDVAALHASCEYVVYFVGFQPGFAYLGDLDERLRLPRRDAPRAAVPAGSVAIATHLTAVYPFTSPGGWHIIGRTSATVFDAAKAHALFAPGDRVRFRRLA
jgi:5-oxoprolinase (ATP-hydrolysing) subunit B